MRQPPYLQRHIARASVAPTTLRGMLEAGGRRIVCEYLASVDVSSVATSDYPTFLDDSTTALAKLIGDRWGPARKAFNLFMRDMTYNHWTRSNWMLHEIEPLLEIPLDSKTMKGIYEYTGDRNLCLTPVKTLDPKLSAKFQDAATAIAEKEGIARVHLDLRWWSNNESN